MKKLFIDGKMIEAVEGQTILEAALAANIYIPHLCTHPDLPVQGNCNLCVVKIEGRDKLVKSCEYEIADGMCVITNSEPVKKARNIAMELMLASHPNDCTSCKAYLKCELQTLMQYMGTVNARMRHIQREAININNKNPLIVREMERCIQCGRCVRACRELRGVDILGYNKLGWETYIGTENDLPLSDAGCRFCGACVEVCPTGALQDAAGIFRTDLPREAALVPCSAECPAKIDIPRYIRYINNGQYSQSVAVIREKVPFPHLLGYVCSHRCETSCKREKLNESIAIRDLKRYAVEHDTEKVWIENYLKPLAADTGKRVAVIGSGPCGLTAAFYLKKKGHDVTVFERLSIAGGMMATGIPAYRASGKAVREEINIIRQAGVIIKTNSNIDSVAALKKDYDAVLVAAGTARGKKLRSIPGWDCTDVFTAIDLLRSHRLGQTINIGNTVNIIGGGNVAYDCARTLLRMGKKVNIVCLEKGDGMLADREEITQAAEEGAVLYDGTTSICFELKDGHIVGHRIADVAAFHFDHERKLVVETVEGSARMIPCDCIVFSAGQVTDLTVDFGLELNSFGYPVVDQKKLMTSVEGVFASGDVITGTKSVIEAIAGGRDAACLIDRYLGGNGQIDEQLILYESGDPKIGKVESFTEKPREVMAVRPSQERKSDFEPLSAGLLDSQASKESGRCLQCDLRRQITKIKLWTEYAVKEV